MMSNENERRWAEQTQGWNWMAKLFLYRTAGLFGTPATSRKPYVTKRRPRKFGEQ